MSLYLPLELAPLDSSETLDPILLDRILQNESIRHSAAAFLSRPPVRFEAAQPEPLFPTTEMLGQLHIFQREAVLVSNSDLTNVRHIGSNEATTCVIVAMWTPEQTFVAHLDGAGDELRSEFSESFRGMHCNGDSMIDVHLVGGYTEQSGLSRAIFQGIVGTLLHDSQGRRFCLRTVVVDELNTLLSQEQGDVDRPKATNLCINVQSGEVARSVYPNYVETVNLGPDYRLRQVRMNVARTGAQSLFRVQIVSIDRLVIPRIGFLSPQPRRLSQLLQIPDRRLLDLCSTSPDVESDTFVPLLRDGWRFMCEFPNDLAYYHDRVDPITQHEFVWARGQDGVWTWQKE